MSKFTLLSFLLFAVAIHQSSAVELSFDEPSDLDGFELRDEFQWRPINWSANGGIDGSPSVVATRPHDSTLQTFTTSLSDEPVVSLFVRPLDPGTIGPGSSISYGEIYLAEDSEGWDSDIVSVTLRETSSGVGLWGGVIPNGGGSFNGFSSTYAAGLIQPENWYELKVGFGTANGRVSFDIEVNDWGTDGTSLVSNVISSSELEIDNLGVSFDSSLYAGFLVSQSIANADNFTIVPEPTSCWLAIVLSVLLVGVQRRSRQ